MRISVETDQGEMIPLDAFKASFIRELNKGVVTSIKRDGGHLIAAAERKENITTEDGVNVSIKTTMILTEITLP